MSIPRLLHDAAAEIPSGLERPPLATMRSGIRRRRTRRVVLIGLAVVAVLGIGAAMVPGRDVAAPAAVPTASPHLSATPVDAMPSGPYLVSAFVSRDDKSITALLRVPPGMKCHDFALPPQVSISAESTTNVTLAVSGRVWAIEPCQTDSGARSVVVPLGRPLAGRELVDASVGRPVTVVHERDLPILPGDWRLQRVTPGDWQGSYLIANWTGGGPQGIALVATNTDPRADLPTVATVQLGSRTGRIAGSPERWHVLWKVGKLTYWMFIDSSSQKMPLTEVKRMLARSTWS